ncbi:MAG: Pyrrolo-quinoline quinone, partial [Verrucomicrobiales bacterium]|nr:Pyrrolo-quinoline quinone [Verrucomicrobiales bacterium]
WLQFCGDSRHTCVNSSETTLNPDNVKGLKKIFSVPLDNATDAQPAFLSGVTTPMGPKDLLFVLTSQSQLVAMDAYTGATVWSKKYPGATYLVTGPVIDPDRKFIYTYGLDGKVHKLQVGDGTEILTGGWPEVSTAQTKMRGYTLSQATTKSGAKYLYSNVTAYINSPGSITVINLGDGSQHVFNGNCSNVDAHFGLAGAPANCADGGGGNAWSRQGVVYHPDLDLAYTTFGTDGGGGYSLTKFNWTAAIIAMRPDGTTNNGMPVNTYNNGGCYPTAPGIIPTLPGCKYKYLGVQANKGSQLWFINMENLSNQANPFGNPAAIAPKLTLPQGGLIYAGPTVWTNPADNTVWVYVGSENGLGAVQIGVDGNGNPTMTNKWSQKTSFTTTPFVANGVLYVTDGGGQARFWAGDDHGIKKIYAMNPTTGAVLWSDTINYHHWSSPIVVNGVLYIGDGKTGEGGISQANKGAMTAYSLTTDHPISTLGAVEIPGFSYRIHPGLLHLTLPLQRPAEFALMSLTGRTLMQRWLQGGPQYEIPLQAGIRGALLMRVRQGQGEFTRRIHLD